MDIHLGSTAFAARRSARQRRLQGTSYPGLPVGSRSRHDATDAASAKLSRSSSERAALLHPSPKRLPAAHRLPIAPVSPSGFHKLDGWLPEGGWPRGAFTELLTGRDDASALRLLAPALAATLQAGRLVMLFDPPPTLSVWMLGRLGIDARQLLTIDGRVPLSPAAGSLWLLEQALASGSVGAVVAWLPGQWLPAGPWPGLQQAVRRHDGPAFLIRKAAAVSEPRGSSLDEGGGLRLSVQVAGTDRLALRRIPRVGENEAGGRLLIEVVPLAGAGAGDGAAPPANLPSGASTVRIDGRDDAAAAGGLSPPALRSAGNDTAAVCMLPAGDVVVPAGPSASRAVSAAGEAGCSCDADVRRRPLRAAVFVDLGG